MEETALFCPSFARKSRGLAPCAQCIGTKRGLAITLARAIVASPHSHEDESSWHASAIIIGMTSGVNPFFLAVRRPRTLSI
jgi:hypothetical protein